MEEEKLTKEEWQMILAMLNQAQVQGKENMIRYLALLAKVERNAEKPS